MSAAPPRAGNAAATALLAALPLSAPAGGPGPCRNSTKWEARPPPSFAAPCHRWTRHNNKWSVSLRPPAASGAAGIDILKVSVTPSGRHVFVLGDLQWVSLLKWGRLRCVPLTPISGRLQLPAQRPAIGLFWCRCRAPMPARGRAPRQHLRMQPSGAHTAQRARRLRCPAPHGGPPAALAPQLKDGDYLSKKGPKGVRVQHVWRYSVAADAWSVVHTVEIPNVSRGNAGTLDSLAAGSNVAAWVGHFSERRGRGAEGPASVDGRGGVQLAARCCRAAGSLAPHASRRAAPPPQRARARPLPCALPPADSGRVSAFNGSAWSVSRPESGANDDYVTGLTAVAANRAWARMMVGYKDTLVWFNGAAWVPKVRPASAGGGAWPRPGAARHAGVAAAGSAGNGRQREKQAGVAAAGSATAPPRAGGIALHPLFCCMHWLQRPPSPPLPAALQLATGDGGFLRALTAPGPRFALATEQVDSSSEQTAAAGRLWRWDGATGAFKLDFAFTSASAFNAFNGTYADHAVHAASNSWAVFARTAKESGSTAAAELYRLEARVWSAGAWKAAPALRNLRSQYVHRVLALPGGTALAAFQGGAGVWRLA